MCVFVGFSLLISVRLFAFIAQSEEVTERESRRESERKEEKSGDERVNLPKGTENKWSGRKNKTHGREKEEQIRWEGVDQVRKWDERSVREGQRVKVSI